MDSFELDVKKGLYKINEEIIVKRSDVNQYLVYLIDYKGKQLFRYEVNQAFQLDVQNEIYVYEHIVYIALGLEFRKITFNDEDTLKEYVKVNILNEFTEDDFCDKVKFPKRYRRLSQVMAIVNHNILDLMKLICILSLFSIFNYFVNNKAIFMLNSIYGESMKPTLKKYSAGVIVYPYHITYGDLIASRKEVDGEKINVLKRVIALPGDKVEIINDYVYVNGVKIEEAYLPDDYRTNNHEYVSFETIWKRTIRNQSITYDISEVPDVIPANYYFVLGDNRQDSYDSRHFGLIYFDEIVGEYIFTLITI